MKKHTPLVTVAVLYAGFLLGIGWGISESTAAQRDIAGKWLGTIAVSGVELRIAFEISKANEGGYTAVMHSIDQGAMNIAVSAVTLIGDSLKMEVKSIPGAYTGALSPDGSSIDGKWFQGGAVPLVIRRVDKFPEFNRPQTPKKPFPYRDEEVVFENQKAGVKLAGTLTLPQGKGPYPAVILLTGSGPQNRDEEVFSHRPFLVLADHLTRRGIAVLRFDDRGVGGSTGDFSKATTGDFADDALAGLEFLKGRNEIDPKRIGLLGHSEGGMIGPIAATRTPDVAFLVMLAGPGQRFGDVVAFQILQAARNQGADEAQLTLMRSWYGRLYGILAENTDNAFAEKKIRDLHATLTPDEKTKLNWPDGRLKGDLPNQFRPWWRYAMQYDPRATLLKVKCPVLALNGEKDMQVPVKENLPAVEAALKAGGNTRSTVKALPGLNHLFQTCDTGAESEYIKIEETMSPLALQTVSGWIIEQAGVGKSGK
ncbi:MAG: alpha/beta hydrolase family protein [Candidatus Latescibacterota bacterium]